MSKSVFDALWDGPGPQLGPRLEKVRKKQICISICRLIWNHFQNHFRKKIEKSAKNPKNNNGFFNFLADGGRTPTRAVARTVISPGLSLRLLRSQI